MVDSRTFASIVLVVLSSGAPAALGGGGEACDAGLAAYRKTVFPLVRAKCVACHDSPAKGPKQGPAHSVADAAASYRKMLTFLDAESPELTTLVDTGENGHCRTLGVNCGVGPGDLLPAVKRWWEDGQKACASALRNVTEAIALPRDLPTREKGFRAFEIPLASLGAGLRDARLRIEGQLFSPVQKGVAPGAYRFRNPRLILTGDQSYRVKGVRILLNGKWDPKASSFLAIDEIVNAKSAAVRARGDRSSAPLSHGAQILIQEKAEGDTLSFAFDLIEPASARHCTAPDVFAKTVAPVVDHRKCMDCHGPSATRSTSAKMSLFMSGVDAELCDEFLARSRGVSGPTTALVRYATGREVNHFPSIPTAAEVKTISDWIDLERKSAAK